jgi:hypothetical protein
MSDGDSSNRRWQGLALVPFGLVAIGLGAFLLYQNFVASQPLIQGGLGLAIISLIAGAVGVVVGTRRLAGWG